MITFRHNKLIHFTLARLILIYIIITMTNGCAFLNRDNTPLLNTVEKKLWPKKTGFRVLALPFLFPVGLTAITIDAVIIHPASVVDDAIEDVKDALWDNFKWEKRYMTECAILPWRAISTPVVFTFDFIFRAMFDIPDKAQEIRKKEENSATLSKVQALMNEGKYSEAYDKLMSMHRYEITDKEMRIFYEYLLLKCAYKDNQYEQIKYPYYSKDLMNSEYAQEIKSIVKEMEESSNPLARWTGYDFDISSKENLKESIGIIQKALKDSNPIIRYKTLSNIDKCIPGAAREIEDLKDDLKQVANEDSDLMNRAYAEQIIRRLNRVLKK